MSIQSQEPFLESNTLADAAGINLAAVSAAGALKTDGSAVTQPVSGTVAVSNLVAPIGTQANAWNNVAVISGTNSPAIDCQFVTTITIFGTVSANLNPLRIQASQDNINFFTITTLSIATGNWGTTITLGARYIRLQAGQAATITATIAGK